jgi:hypothetical protein
MMTVTRLAPAASGSPELFTGRLRLALAACLARFEGSSREHTESDLRCYLSWYAQRGLDPLAGTRWSPGSADAKLARWPSRLTMVELRAL